MSKVAVFVPNWTKTGPNLWSPISTIFQVIRFLFAQKFVLSVDLLYFARHINSAAVRSSCNRIYTFLYFFQCLGQGFCMGICVHSREKQSQQKILPTHWALNAEPHFLSLLQCKHLKSNTKANSFFLFFFSLGHLCRLEWNVCGVCWKHCLITFLNTICSQARF